MTPDQRIAKLLARAGVASRREIERMIAEGRIALNGVTIDTPATLLSSLDGVTVDGDPVAAPEPTRLFLYHKPTGLLVTEHDPAGRPTIYDRLPEGLPRLVPVGRLDLNTEGLLLLTTDGGFKRQLELPATGVERTYRARAYGDITQAQLEELIHGIEIDGIRYGQIDANLERRTGANVWIEMTLREGKNREVRRVLEHLGLQVSRLIRLRYGPFVLDELPVGDIGEVRGADIVEFRRSLEGGIPADAVKPAKIKPGFRTPPTRAAGERPARAGAGDARGGASDRPRSQERMGSGDRSRRDDARPSSAYARNDRPAREGVRSDRPREGAKPYGRPPTNERSGFGGQRPSRFEDRTERPARDGVRSDRARPGAKPFAKSPTGERSGSGGQRPSRFDDRAERPAREGGRSDRSRRDAKPFGSAATGERYGSGGQRASRSEDRGERPARDGARSDRSRGDTKPFAKPASGPRQPRFDDRGDRPARPSRGPQGSPGRSGGPSRPDSRGGGRPNGGGSRPGRPGGHR
ncbi:pseudouridine synthase [Sphingomonas yabuuchiae]|uniref:Pseudouridine synthase n=1 Tax=Sphingomonas yabuuchiae TaxID=172044 RepID=A0AA40ZZP8_9SPHN|nr:pseudouridine synthase [Sphingomonas yabuuchiae]MBB4608675.1 23S rRNA pseudouridine2605 synthase [Sphingomonas yabuuchiae]MBN3558992.1 pseudouridine synthase [Sphingomonas yabuuchiae]